MSRVAWSVCLSVFSSNGCGVQKQLNRTRCRLEGLGLTRVSPRNHELDGDKIPTGMDNFGGCPAHWKALETLLRCIQQKDHSITGSAVALHCCKAHSKSIGKMENSTPCKIVTPKNFILKLGTRDYVENITHYTNFHVHRFSGASPQIGEM